MPDDTEEDDPAEDASETGGENQYGGGSQDVDTVEQTEAREASDEDG